MPARASGCLPSSAGPTASCSACAGCTTSTTGSQASTRWRGGSPARTGAWGYATEAATAWLDHGFDTMGLHRVISVTDRDPPNVRSLAVMRRLGMVFDHDTVLTEDDGAPFAATVHSVTAVQWRDHRRR